jgi:hypothetical protein
MLEEDSAVLYWDTIVHKNVRHRDGQDAGNVDAVDADSIVIITEKRVQATKITSRSIQWCRSILEIKYFRIREV